MSNREIWRHVRGFEEFYRVSNLGKVWSVPRIVIRKNGRKYRVRGKILIATPLNGYAGVSLNLDGSVKNVYVHHIVMEAFVGDCPKNMEINHKDGDKMNGRVDNLEYVSHKKNVEHALAVGLIARGSGRSDSKLSEKDVRKIRELRELRGTETGRALAKKYSVSGSLISHIQLGKRRLHG